MHCGAVTCDSEVNLVSRVQQPHFGSFCRGLSFVRLSLLEIGDRGINLNVVMAGLVYLGLTRWLGWLLWTALLCLPGMRHPSVEDREPLSTTTLILAPLALLILVLTATPAPFLHSSLLEVIQRMRN